MQVISDCRVEMSEGDRLVAGIKHGDHCVIVTDKTGDDHDWREYYFHADRVKVKKMTRYGWSSTTTTGDYDDWQIREGVILAAEVAGITIPEEWWYAE